MATLTPDHQQMPNTSASTWPDTALPVRGTLSQRIGARLRKLVKHYVDRKLGPYCQPYNKVDLTLPKQLTTFRTVVVIGGGLAGLSAACNLAERGFSVTLIEKEDYLGGKVGAWTDTTANFTGQLVQLGVRK